MEQNIKSFTPSYCAVEIGRAIEKSQSWPYVDGVITMGSQ